MEGQKYVWTSGLIQTSWLLSCTVTATISTSILRKLTKKQRSWKNEYIYCVTLTYFPSDALYWMKELFVIKTNFVKNEWYLSSDHFQIEPRVKIDLWTLQFSQKLSFECVSLLVWLTFRTWDGPKFYIWWNHWLWWLILWFPIMSFQSIYFICTTTWCYRGSAGP